MDVKIEESLLTDGQDPDIEKIRPIVYGPEVGQYYGVGKLIGKAFDIGRKK